MAFGLHRYFLQSKNWILSTRHLKLQPSNGITQSFDFLKLSVNLKKIGMIHLSKREGAPIKIELIKTVKIKQLLWCTIMMQVID